MEIYYLEENSNNYHELEIRERVTETVKYLKNKYLKKIFINENNINILDDDILKYLYNVYSIDYINKIKSTDQKYLQIDLDTHITPYTYFEILNSNKLIKSCLDKIINKKINYGYCLVRPPSHHSSKDCHSGFCIVNNTYLAADYFSKQTNSKVLILDWDLHHGDGTEKLIRNQNNKLIDFISIHCFEKGFYPGTGDKKNNNEQIQNYPMKKYSNDEKYYEQFEYIFKQINKNDYKLIIISNGLDAHIDDTFSTMKLTTKFYSNISKKLKLLNVPIIYILEGGYNINVIKEVSNEIISIFV